ncbi:MAG: alpha-galactosidase, partial [Clostridia bacterium]
MQPFRAGDVTVELAEADGSLAVFVQAHNTPVRELVLTWKAMFGRAGEVLGDTWERGYGDLNGKRKQIISECRSTFPACGENAWHLVKVRPSAMCWWEKDGADVKLHLDVRCGTYGVKLGGRKLAAKIVMTSYALEEADTPVEVFEACRAFCSEMCDDPDCRDTVIYGGNNWYYAYGKSSAKEILEDSAYLAEMTEGIENRPFMVMDDGWQIDHSDSYNGGPWRVGNADYGDMG